MLLFRCSRFSTSVNWISLQPKFSCILVARLVAKLNPLARASSAIDALRDAQKMCAVTKVGTVLKVTSSIRRSKIMFFMG